jgi:hypothetical protein
VPAQQDFIEQAAPFRAELIAHCFDVESPDVGFQLYVRRTEDHDAIRDLLDG